MTATPIVSNLVRSPGDFREYTGTEYRIHGGSSPELRLFVEHATGELFVGKSSMTAICSDAALAQASTQSGVFVIARYQEELREILALLLYEYALGVPVPSVYLCLQPLQITLPSDLVIDHVTPRLHLMTRYVQGLSLLGPDFVSQYRNHARRRPMERYTVVISDTEERRAPLFGFGALLAAAAVLDDRDVVGASGGNTGYTYNDTLNRCEILKFDGGHAFAFLTGDSSGKGNGVVSIKYDLSNSIPFTDLCEPDRDEYIITLQQAIRNIVPTDPDSLVCRLASTLSSAPGDSRRDDQLSPDYTRMLLDSLSAHFSPIIGYYHDMITKSLVHQVENMALHVAREAQRSDDPIDVDAEFTAAERQAAMTHGNMARHLPVTPSRSGLFTFQLPSTPHVVGRSEELSELAMLLRDYRSSRIVARAHDTAPPHRMSIAGMGGVGKTTVAAQYASLAARGESINVKDANIVLNYSYVVWLRSEHDADLDQQFIALAEQLSGDSFTSGNSARNKLWDIFRGARWPTLIVFDNVADVGRLLSLLPPLQPTTMEGVHMIVTTRDNRPCPDIATLHLETFDVAGTQAFVRARFPGGSAINEDSIVTLHIAVDGLPLALVQVCSYMQRTGLSLERVLQLFSANQADSILHGQLLDDPHPRAVGTMVTLAAAHLEYTCPEAAALLWCAAYLPPDNLVAEVWMGGAQINDREAFIQAADALRAVGLAGMCVDGSYTIHRLIQACVRHHLACMQSEGHIITRLLQGHVDGLTNDLPLIRAPFLASAEFTYNCVEDARSVTERDSKEMFCLSIAWARAYDLNIHGDIAVWRYTETFLDCALFRLHEETGYDYYTVSSQYMHDPFALVERGVRAAISVNKRDDRLFRGLIVACKFIAEITKGNEPFARRLSDVGERYGLDIRTEAYLARLLSTVGADRTEQLVHANRSLSLFEQLEQPCADAACVMESMCGLCERPELIDLSSKSVIMFQRMWPSLTAPTLSTNTDFDSQNTIRTLILSVVLDVKQSLYGPNHLQTASTLAKLAECESGSTYTYVLERALRITESFHGARSHHVIPLMRRLCKAYDELPSQQRRRSELLRRMADIYDSDEYEYPRPSVDEIDDILGALTTYTLELAPSCANTMLVEQYRLRRFRNIEKLNNDNSSPEILHRLRELGLNLVARKDMPLARAAFACVLSVQQSHERMNYGLVRDYFRSACDFGECCACFGEFTDAVFYYRVAVSLNLSCDHFLFANAIEMLGLCLFCVGEDMTALRTMNECLALRAALNETEATAILNSVSGLAWQTQWNIKLIEAESTRNFDSLWALLTSAPPNIHPYDIDCRLNAARNHVPDYASDSMVIFGPTKPFSTPIEKVKQELNAMMQTSPRKVVISRLTTNKFI